MDIRTRIFGCAASIRLGIVSDDPRVYRHVLPELLPVIEHWPELTAAALAFIGDTTLAESHGYTRPTLILTIAAALENPKGPLN